MSDNLDDLVLLLEREYAGEHVTVPATDIARRARSRTRRRRAGIAAAAVFVVAVSVAAVAAPLGGPIAAEIGTSNGTPPPERPLTQADVDRNCRLAWTLEQQPGWPASAVPALLTTLRYRDAGLSVYISPGGANLRCQFSYVQHGLHSVGSMGRSVGISGSADLLDSDGLWGGTSNGVGSLSGTVPAGTYRVVARSADGESVPAPFVGGGWFALMASEPFVRGAGQVTAYQPRSAVALWRDQLDAPSLAAYCATVVPDVLRHIDGAADAGLPPQRFSVADDRHTLRVFADDRTFAVCRAGMVQVWTSLDGPADPHALTAHTDDVTGGGYVTGTAPAGTQAVTAVLANQHQITAQLNGDAYLARWGETAAVVSVIARTPTAIYTIERGVVTITPR